jgi:hypothetical protein
VSGGLAVVAHVSAQPAPCRGADFAGSFAVVRGSAGAGNIVYRLRLTKTTPGSCFVSGIPQLRLLARDGRELPTHATAAHPTQLTAVRVVLARGRATSLTARFSPDVPGPGEPTGATCEPVADRLRVAPGSGTVTVPIRPPTPVCEHGALSLSAFG